MKKLDCKLVCEKGYWFIELPFNSGTIDLGSSFDEIKDFNNELKVIDYAENGLTIFEISKEMDYDLDTIKAIVDKIDALSLNSESEDKA